MQNYVKNLVNLMVSISHQGLGKRAYRFVLFERLDLRYFTECVESFVVSLIDILHARISDDCEGQILNISQSMSETGGQLYAQIVRGFK